MYWEITCWTCPPSIRGLSILEKEIENEYTNDFSLYWI